MCNGFIDMQVSKNPGTFVAATTCMEIVIVGVLVYERYLSWRYSSHDT